MVENNMIEEIRKMNLKLHEELGLKGNYTDEEYTPTMLKFLNSIDHQFVVKFIYYFGDFNKYLTNKEDLEKAIEFYNKVDGKIDGSFSDSSKFGSKSTVFLLISLNNSKDIFDNLDSV